MSVEAIRWPDTRTGPWTITTHWLETGGREECVGIEIWRGIEPYKEARAITAEDVQGEVVVHRTPFGDGSFEIIEGYRTLPGRAPEALPASDLSRKFPFATLIDEGRQELLRLHNLAGDLISQVGYPEVGEVFRSDAHSRIDPDSIEKGPGRPVHWNRERIREVAQVYAEAWRSGKPPRRAVAAHFDVSSSNAAKLVARAREEGLLGKTKPGRAGGVTGPTADDIAAARRMARAGFNPAHYRIYWPDASDDKIRRAAESVDGELEQRAAHAPFHLDPYVVSVVSHKLWGRSLSEERDCRLAAATRKGPRSADRVAQALIERIKVVISEIREEQLKPKQELGLWPLRVPGTDEWVFIHVWAGEPTGDISGTDSALAAFALVFPDKDGG